MCIVKCWLRSCRACGAIVDSVRNRPGQNPTACTRSSCNSDCRLTAWITVQALCAVQRILHLTVNASHPVSAGLLASFTLRAYAVPTTRSGWTYLTRTTIVHWMCSIKTWYARRAMRRVGALDSTAVLTSSGIGGWLLADITSDTFCSRGP